VDRPASSPFTAHRRLRELAESRGDEPFVLEAHEDGSHLSYAELYEQAARLATVLRDRGVAPGGRVFTQLGNRWESLAALFAASLLGAVVVPLAPGSSADDVAYAVEQTQPSAGLVLGDDPELLAVIAESGLAPSALLAATADPGSGLVTIAAATAEATALSDSVAGQITDLLMVSYKAGTSGWPNGVMLTHANLRHAGTTYAAMTRLQSGDRVLVSFPISHIAGLGNMVMGALWSGAKLGFTAPGRAWIETAARQRSTVANVTAVDVRELLAVEPLDPQPQELRLVVFGPAVPASVRQQFERRFDTELRLGYGTTEAVAPISIWSPTITPDDECVGEVFAAQSLKVVDERNVPVAHGEPGELVVTGVPGVTLAAGYYGRPDLTEAVFASGSLHTGDRVILYPDGRLKFLGRTTETLKTALVSISAVELERVLKEHVGVVDAAVVEVATADSAQIIVAFVVLSEYHFDVAEAELAAWVATRVGEGRCPDRYRFVDVLPYSAFGKILKAELIRTWLT